MNREYLVIRDIIRQRLIAIVKQSLQHPILINYALAEPERNKTVPLQDESLEICETIP